MTAARSTTSSRESRGSSSGDRAPAPPTTLPHNVEAETAVLAHCLLDNQVFHLISASLTPPDFHAPLHGAIYTAIASLIADDRRADVVTLSPKLREMNIGEASAYDYVATLPDSAPTDVTITAAYVEEILRYSSQRSMLEAAAELTKLATSRDARVHDIASSVTAKLEASINRIKPKRITQRSVGEFAQIALDNAMDPNKKRGIKTQIDAFDKRTGGLFPGDFSILGGRPSSGKAQSVDAPILLRDGTWRRMGDLMVGDALASVDGQPSSVTALHPQGQLQLYRVTFSDGRSTECCAEHLWRVMYRDWDAPRIISTIKLIEMLSRVRYRNRLWIDTVSGDFGADVGLPIDPYVLGSLIANGSFVYSYLHLSTPHACVIDRVRLALGETANISFIGGAGGVDWAITGNRPGAHFSNPVREGLRALGLLGCRSETKFIPPAYLSASKAARTALLCGLMDGDGCVDKRTGVGGMCYGTSSPQLADDVCQLVRSLGGHVTTSSKIPNYSYLGERKQGLLAYRLVISFDDGTPFVSVPAKLERLTPRTRQCRMTFTSIEPSRLAEAQCISVSHPDQLYVTSDYIVTHNTVLATQIALNLAKQNRGVLYLSLEMDGEAMAQRTLSSESFTDHYGIHYTKFRSDELDERDFRLLQEAQQRIATIPLQIETHTSLTLQQVVARCRQLKADWEAIGQSLDVLIVDYLTLLKFSDRWKGQRVYEVAELSTGMKDLARTLDMHVMAVHQLSRQLENRDDKRPMMSDLRESGQLEQDADLIMMCYREAYYLERALKKGDLEAEEMLRKVKHKMELNIVKQRMGAVGSIELYCSVACNVIRNLGAY